MSLYVYLFGSLVVWLTVTKAVRWLMATLVLPKLKPDGTEGLNFVYVHRNRLQFIVTSMLSIGMITLIFRYLSLWFPFFKKPHTLLIIAIDMHMMASSFMDGFFPDIPAP